MELLSGSNLLKRTVLEHDENFNKSEEWEIGVLSTLEWQIFWSFRPNWNKLRDRQSFTNIRYAGTKGASGAFGLPLVLNPTCWLSFIVLRSSEHSLTYQNSSCSNVSTTPLRQWGFRQCLPFSWTTLRGKHCRHPIAIMGVVDTFGLGLSCGNNWKKIEWHLIFQKSSGDRQGVWLTFYQFTLLSNYRLKWYKIQPDQHYYKHLKLKTASIFFLKLESDFFDLLILHKTFATNTLIIYFL